MPSGTHTHPSPNRLLAAFVAAKLKLLVALKDEGGMFECRFMARLLERSIRCIATAHSDAVDIDSQLSTLSSQLRRDLAADDDTPGILDPVESEQLLKKVAALGLTARHHASHLEQLT